MKKNRLKKIADMIKGKENAGYVWLNGKRYTIKEAIQLAVKEIQDKI
jgi:hypothetical protein